MKIDGILVVEGKSDVAFLSNFIETEFVITNGSEISKDTIEYLKKASLSKDIYVLTDPDFPGEKIRKTLDENIKGLHHCFVEKNKSIKNGKVGVAESSEEEVIKALKNAKTFSDEKKNNISMSDLISLSLSGDQEASKRREKVAKKLNIGHCNAKTFLKRINSCDINIEDLKKLI